MDRNIGHLLKIFLKYLRRTKELFLVNGEGDLQVSRYVDTSFQSDKDDCKSQIRFYLIHYEWMSICFGRVPNKILLRPSTL